jgi:uncharacterized protein with PhoU and TrkA domain
VNEEQAWALTGTLRRNEPVTLATLLQDPLVSDHGLEAIVLMLRRGGDRLLLPPAEERLKVGDKLLMCGHPRAFNRLHWTLNHEHTLRYLRTGDSNPDGWVWRKLAARRRAREAGS